MKMETITQIGRFALPALGALILGYCLFSLLRKKYNSVTGTFLQNTANGDILPLRNGETSIGRSKNCDIILNYTTVSRSHAVIAKRKKGWFVVDTRSTTGTNVNGEPVNQKVCLEDGDIITLGGASLVFKTGD